MAPQRGEAMNATGTDAIERFLADKVDAGEIPGAVWAVAGRDGMLASGAVGNAALLPQPEPARLDTIYDLGSLTKPLITALLFLAMGRDLGLDTGAVARRFVPELDRMDKRGITIRHLLTHTAGLPAWAPLYTSGTTMAEYLREIRDTALVAPIGTRVVYSCMGYIVMGEILERCASQPLDRLASEVILRPLKLTSTLYRPPKEWRSRVAPTEDSCEYERKLAGSRADGYAGYRRGIIRGEVHDQNAWALGGVAGNAGLFSTVEEVASLALQFLGPGRGLLDGAALRSAREDQTPGLQEARSMAFLIAARGETSAGPDLSGESFGHNGFPGTSVWIDPVRQRVYVLLTNRVHPRAIEGYDMMPLRRRFHSLASGI